MRLYKKGWAIILLFLGGGIFFWITQPQLGLGQIWVAMAVFVLIVYVYAGVRSRLAEDKARAAMGQAAGASWPAGQTTSTFGNVSMSSAAGASTMMGGGADVGKAVMDVLRQHGIDPTVSGTYDLSNLAAAREGILKALQEHGFDVAHQLAIASPAVPIQASQEPVERMSKLKQLHDSGLITTTEYEAAKKHILDEL